jgi:hypothetical protein
MPIMIEEMQAEVRPDQAGAAQSDQRRAGARCGTRG